MLPFEINLASYSMLLFASSTMSNFSQQGRLFISGLSDREARKLSRARLLLREQSDKVQRGARMPEQCRAGQLVMLYFFTL